MGYDMLRHEVPFSDDWDPARSNDGLRSNAISQVEHILQTSPVITQRFRVVRGSESGDQQLSLHRVEDGQPLEFASVQLEGSTGRFYRSYPIGWEGKDRRIGRYYFAHPNDAADYLAYLAK